MSVMAHCTAGVVPWETMIAIVESLCQTAELKPGDRVKTLRGSLHGVIVPLLADRRVVWRRGSTPSELTALPESLCADEEPKA